jgi:tetratricopeptide (TPR) repeat protein
MTGGVKGKGIMAVIRQEGGGLPAAGGKSQAPAVSELMLLLDEKAREAEKLKARIAGMEKLIEELSRRPPPPAFEDDSPLAIDALRAKGEELYRKGVLLDAFYVYRRIIRLNPHDVDALYRVATIYHSARMSAKAADVLRMILEIDPSQARAGESLRELERGL